MEKQFQEALGQFGMQKNWLEKGPGDCPITENGWITVYTFTVPNA